MSTMLLVAPCSPGSAGPHFALFFGKHPSFQDSELLRVPTNSFLVPKESSASPHWAPGVCCGGEGQHRVTWPAFP